MNLLHYVPREKLESILERFRGALGVSVCVLDPDRNLVAGPEDALREPGLSSEIRFGGRHVGYLVAPGELKGGETAASRALSLLQEQLQDSARAASESDELSAEIVHSYRILNVVYELNVRLGSVVDVSKVCDIFLEQALEGVAADTAVLALRSPEGTPWIVESQFGPATAETMVGSRVEDEAVEAAASRGDPLLCDEPSNLPPELHALGKSGLCQFPLLWIPLRVKDNVIGFLLLARPTSGVPFLTDDLKLLRAAATCASTVIQNVRLVEDLQGSLNELRRRSETIKEMQSALMSSQKASALGQLAAGVVHDIKNPLTVISAYAQLLTDEEMSAEAPQFASAILEASGQVSQIVKRVLDFYRQRPPERRWEDINDILEDLMIFAEYYLSKLRMVEVNRELAQDLPSVLIDRGQFQEVFFNLIMNACHAMEEGGVLNIKTRRLPTANGAEMVGISFADTGCGIPEDQLKSIFKPFVTTRQPGEGTGLGLAICDRVIREHGGKIRAESEVGQGTAFHISLPRRPPEAATPGGGENGA